MTVYTLVQTKGSILCAPTLSFPRAIRRFPPANLHALLGWPELDPDEQEAVVTWCSQVVTKQADGTQTTQKTKGKRKAASTAKPKENKRTKKAKEADPTPQVVD